VKAFWVKESERIGAGAYAGKSTYPRHGVMASPQALASQLATVSMPLWRPLAWQACLRLCLRMNASSMGWLASFCSTLA
jgi:hypothetical protein